MKAEQWERIEVIFQSALALKDSVRAAYLDRACAGDKSLQHEVESLLAAYKKTGNFMNVPAHQVAARLIAGDCSRLEQGEGKRPSGSPTLPLEGDELGKDDEPGLLSERFLIQKRIGRGGFGVVYQAFDRERLMEVAIKVLHRVSPQGLLHFKNEFRVLADIVHPNLVSLYELLFDDGRWLFTMEFVNGCDFVQHVRSTCNVGERLRAAFRQLAEGLCFLHNAGKIHRDLKPSNVLVAEDRVVLLDFGLATNVTIAGPIRPGALLVGTPVYMAPEQTLGHATPASDWYAAGVMLYEALVGRPPFEGPSWRVLAQKQHAEFRPPSDFANAVPADLAALCLSLLSRDPERRPTGREVCDALDPHKQLWSGARSTARSARELVVGRGGELQELHAAFAKAAERTVIVQMHGASGMGKTTLLELFVRELSERDDVLMFAGHCFEREFLPYKALDQVIDALREALSSQTLGGDDTLWSAIGTLSVLFPVLANIPGAAWAGSASAAVDKQELRNYAVSAFRDVLRRLSASRRLVMCIDDVQWGDRDSGLLLAGALETTERLPMLLVVCYRTEEASRVAFLDSLMRVRERNAAVEFRQIPVSPLEMHESLQLVKLLTGDDHVVSDAAEQIARESGGNPYFLTELIRESRPAGSLPLDAGGAQTPALAAPSKCSPGLDELIRSKIDQLSEPGRRLLEVVSIAGEPIEQRAASEAAFDIPAGVQDLLLLLRAQRLIRVRHAESDQHLETYHDRVREVVRSVIGTEAAKAYHGRIGLALEQFGRATPDSLAIHFHAAGDREKALSYAGIAADRSFAALAFDNAARFYNLALDNLTRTDKRRTRFQMQFGEALANAGRGAEAANVFLEAAAGLDAVESLEARRRASMQFLVSGHIQEGLKTIRSLASDLRLKLPWSRRRAILRLLTGRARIWLRGLHQRHSEHYQSSPMYLARVDACWAVVQGLSMVDPILAAACHSRHMLLALNAGDPLRVARALSTEAGYLAMAGTRLRGRRDLLVSKAVAMARTSQQFDAIGLAKLVGGMAAFLEGRWMEARDRLDEVEAYLREHCTGVAWELATARLMGCVVLFFLGEWVQLLDRLPCLLQDAEARGDRYESTDLRIRIAHMMCLAEDEPESGKEQVQRALQLWPPDNFLVQHWWGLIAQSEIALYSGDASLELIHRAWPRLKSSHLLRVQYILIDTLFHRAGAALESAARLPEACPQRERILHQALRDAAHIERERTEWGDAFALLLRASATAIGSERNRAAQILARAERALQRAGMTAYAMAARYRRGELSGADAGTELIDGAETWMRAQRVRQPRLMIRMLAPGFPFSSLSLQ